MYEEVHCNGVYHLKNTNNHVKITQCALAFTTKYSTATKRSNWKSMLPVKGETKVVPAL